jgi:hypothetical protein
MVWPNVGTAERFEDVFEKTAEIRFSGRPDLLIAEIAQLNVGENGDLLVVDDKQNIVFIFDRHGKLVFRLDRAAVEKFLPGTKLIPVNAFFLSNQEFCVQSMNAAEGILYRFDLQGNLLGRIKYNDRNNAFCFALDQRKNLISYNVETPTRIYLRSFNLVTERAKNFGSFPAGFRNAIYRTPVNGLAAEGGQIFQINPVEAKVYVYNGDGELIRTLKNIPSGYNPIQKDIPGDLMVATKRDMQWTWTEALFLLTHNTLLIQFLDPGKSFYFMIWKTDGTVLTGATKIKHRIIAARDSVVYISMQPAPDKNGLLPNPILVTYKWKGNESE